MNPTQTKEAQGQIILNQIDDALTKVFRIDSALFNLPENSESWPKIGDNKKKEISEKLALLEINLYCCVLNASKANGILTNTMK